MKKSATILSAALLVFSLLLFSCAKTPERGADINYRQGFLDISIEYSGNAQEYQARPFNLPILIHNNLAYDIENVVVSILGFDQHYVELFSERENIELIEGKSIFNDGGGKEELLFNGQLGQLLPGASKEEQNYRIYARYNSKIEFTPSICVTGQLTGYETFEGGCQFKPEVTFKGQGAPFGVTQLQIIPRQGRGVELRMLIENKGNGNVGSVSLGAAALGGKPISCEFRGADLQETSLFSFESEQKKVNLLCTGFLSSENSYQTTLLVELFYDYEINVQQTLMILE